MESVNGTDPVSTPARAYQINIYYGIHGLVEDLETVEAALAATKYADLVGEDHETVFDGKSYIRNVNSDFNETRYVIFADEMSIHGKESNEPVSYCKFEPTDLCMSETKHASEIKILTNIYNLIVQAYKKEKIKLKRVYLGWGVYNCEWDDGESASE